MVREKRLHCLRRQSPALMGAGDGPGGLRMVVETGPEAAAPELETGLAAHLAADRIQQVVEAASVRVPHSLPRAKAQPCLVLGEIAMPGFIALPLHREPLIEAGHRLRLQHQPVCFQHLPHIRHVFRPGGSMANT